MRSLVWTGVGLAVIYGLLCSALFFGQRSFLYYPRPASNASGLIRVGASGVRVSASCVPHAGPRALLYFGGNAEDVTANLEEFATGMPDRTVFLLHYRGYGFSSGSPSEEALFSDALSLFDDVHEKYSEIELVGRSLGSGVATYVASQRPVTRLVLVTPYDSIQEIAEQAFPYFPVRLLLQDKYESWRYAPKVTAPTVLIVASDDEVIPGASSNRLKTRFRPGVAVTAVLVGATHNTVSLDVRYMGLLRGEDKGGLK